MVGPMSDWSESSLMSVKDMIDMAFGEEEENTCDFRIVHALLLVLARTLAVLDRSVVVEATPDISVESSMVITEVKVKAKRGKGKKGKGKQKMPPPTKDSDVTDKKGRKSVQADKPSDRSEKEEAFKPSRKSKDMRATPDELGKESIKKGPSDKSSDKKSERGPRDETTDSKKPDRQRTTEPDKGRKKEKETLSKKGKRSPGGEHEETSPTQKSKSSPDDRYDDSLPTRKDKRSPDIKYEKGRGKKSPEDKYEEEDSTPSKRGKRSPDDEYDESTPSRKSKRSPDDEYKEGFESSTRKSKRPPDDEYEEGSISPTRRRKRPTDDEYEEGTASPTTKSTRGRDDKYEEGYESPTSRSKRSAEDEYEEGDASSSRKSKRTPDDEYEEDVEGGKPSKKGKKPPVGKYKEDTSVSTKKGKRSPEGKYEEERSEPSSKVRKSPEDKYDEDYSLTSKKGKRTPEDDKYDEDYASRSKKSRRSPDEIDEDYSPASRSQASSEESYDRTSKSSKGTTTPSRSKPGEKGRAPGQKGKKGKADLADLLESPDSSDAQHEKILIVEKLPAGEKAARRKKSWSSASEQEFDRVPQSLVSRPQFIKAVNAVIQLQEQFGPIDVPGFKDNMKLLEAIHKGVPITDPIAALQLSARLETVENAIDKMMKVIQDLGKAKPKYTGTILSKDRPKSAVSGKGGKIQGLEPDQQSVSSKKVAPKDKGKDGTPATDTVSMLSTPLYVTPAEGSDSGRSEETAGEEKKSGIATYNDMRKGVELLEADLKKFIVQAGHRTQLIAENVLKRSKTLDQKLETSGDCDKKADDLELAINQYAEKINGMDAAFSTVMTDVQEELAQMQHNLEVTLDNMAESLANRETDADAVADLTNRFTILQIDLDRTLYLQKDLNQIQNNLRIDLKTLWKDLTALRDIKSDRDEVTEALSTKAGIASLNGLVSLTQFDAVIGDYQKRLASLFDKFNHQEIVWQKAIDDVMRELNEKAEKFQVHALKNNVQKHMDKLREELDFMIEICGEPRTSSDEKATKHEVPCISCNTPARGAMGEPDLLGPRPPTLGGNKDECKSILEKSKHKDKETEEEKREEEDMKKEDGDGDRIRNVCNRYQPITHPIHPRARVCTKICGGLPPKCNVDGSEGISSTIIVQAIEKETGPVLKKIKTKKEVPCVTCNQPMKKLPTHTGPKMYEFVNKYNEASNIDIKDYSNRSLVEHDDMKVEDVSDEDYEGSLNVNDEQTSDVYDDD